MAFSEEHLVIMRQAVSELEVITEKKMFGGVCFMLNGNMLCGVHKERGMARVGKENEEAALAIEGVEPLDFTGRKMRGMVEFSALVICTDALRSAILDLAVEFMGSLPPK